MGAEEVSEGEEDGDVEALANDDSADAANTSASPAVTSIIGDVGDFSLEIDLAAVVSIAGGEGVPLSS